MLALLLTVILGILFAYFSTLNTALTSVNLFGTFLSVPVYILALGSMLLGILISWVISIFNSISTAWAIRKREVKIKQSTHDAEDLRRKVRELEVENTKLKTYANRDDIVVTSSQPRKKSIPELIRQNLLA